MTSLVEGFNILDFSIIYSLHLFLRDRIPQVTHSSLLPPSLSPFFLNLIILSVPAERRAMVSFDETCQCFLSSPDQLYDQPIFASPPLLPFPTTVPTNAASHGPFF